ncbi:lactate utilization protein [Oceanirhabdus sp. W0125-5]|uniref:lactate utilization protein n=1 Tax=Oceanirhabdus sp. W0125-5 TaxID=2999116 RepID=UPI0022F2C23C|nr:lactate utilization protein [Oceanirhabdus sp. W0125-5]WBW94755.1 lactate utilization protein [Oceanirhabdus sp. W0125-5]
MDMNLKFVNDKRIERTIEKLKENNMNAEFVKTKEELLNKINGMLQQDMRVTVGGSMTLFQCGIIELLRNSSANFLDRYTDGLSSEEIRRIYFEAFNSDIYFTSSNAITEEGYLFNVDGRGNRVAAITYGPKKVVVIVGANKIVRDVDEAIMRNREVSGPANAKRLNRKTPCTVTGRCHECSSDDRICCSYVLTKYQLEKDRINVFIMDENLGY